MPRFTAMLCATLLLAASPLSTAYAWPSYVEGYPDVLSSAEAPAGLYVWTDDDNHVFVRVLGQRRYKLSFKLRYGEIWNVREEGLDANDHHEFSEDKGQLFLKINGSDVPEGVRFRPQGNRVQIECETDDGDDCDLEEIHLGAEGYHPVELPFTIDRKD